MWVGNGGRGLRRFLSFSDILHVSNTKLTGIRLPVQDVSRLLDICRQSIYFKTVQDISTCLAAMTRDPDVVICRIKNRFDPGMHSDESAGYRNLAVNIRLDTAETRALAVETHICEVQLLLLQMAAIKVMLVLALIEASVIQMNITLTQTPQSLLCCGKDHKDIEDYNIMYTSQCILI